MFSEFLLKIVSMNEVVQKGGLEIGKGLKVSLDTWCPGVPMN